MWYVTENTGYRLMQYIAEQLNMHWKESQRYVPNSNFRESGIGWDSCNYISFLKEYIDAFMLWIFDIFHSIPWDMYVFTPLLVTRMEWYNEKNFNKEKMFCIECDLYF